MAAADPSYRDQLLLVDGISLSAGLLGDQLSAGNAQLTLGVVGSGVFLGSPIVHASHGHWDRAAAAFAMRAGPPLLTWAAIDWCHERYAADAEGADGACIWGPLFVGGALLAVGIAIDYTVLARGSDAGTANRVMMSWAWPL